MQATRRARVESTILEELSMVVPREVKDPRIPSVTFTSVKLTEDAEQATIFVTILGSLGMTGTRTESDELNARQQMRDCLTGLTSASGYLRRHMAKVLSIRHIPTLIFKEDKGLENSLRVHELLKQLK